MQISDSYVGPDRPARPGERPMNQILDISVAIDVIRRAFEPLVCEVQVYDSEWRLRFHVLGPDNSPVLCVVGLSLRDMIDPPRLRAEIQEARARVEAKGFELKAWITPT